MRHGYQSVWVPLCLVDCSTVAGACGLPIRLLIDRTVHTMGEVAFWGFIGASALIVGAEIAFTGRLNRFVIGLVMAFGVGTLISSVSFELIAPAMNSAETWQVGIALFAGALVFYLGDRAIGNMPSAGDGEGGGGLGIVLGTVLDGIPESVVLGMSISTGGGVSVALLVAIWISNFPESLGATSNLEKSGMERSDRVRGRRGQQ
ncbi:MAG: hypothetical protein GY798_03010 [Hyphomicrobiales bacterium]|nr:hypothetical protein [Hyphomicrobiales bacterium]